RKGARVGLPRDVIFLVDRSCSMRGGSLPQARRAVRVILDHLGPDDAIQLFAFDRSEEHTSELQSLTNLVCRLLLEKKKKSCQPARTALKICRTVVTQSCHIRVCSSVARLRTISRHSGGR